MLGNLQQRTLEEVMLAIRWDVDKFSTSRFPYVFGTASDYYCLDNPAIFDSQELPTEDSIIKVLRDDDGDHLGCIIYISLGSWGLIDFLVVKKESRGKGYGKQLLDYAMQDLRDQGMTHVTVDSSRGAISFYSRYGFTGADLKRYNYEMCYSFEDES